MKSSIHNIETPNYNGIGKLYFENQKISEEVEIVDYFNVPEKGNTIILLHSQLFAENQQTISIRKNKLIIIVSEVVCTYKSNTSFVSDWNTYGQQSYVRMRNISLFLPGDNFYLLRHYFVPEKLILNIVLGEIKSN